ncbi:MAG: uncharacterized protein QOE45_2144 [Frankiaceae bacterium]|nr:uncharacterized protein [Frankiaceae bacterium]
MLRDARSLAVALLACLLALAGCASPATRRAVPTSTTLPPSIVVTTPATVATTSPATGPPVGSSSPPGASARPTEPPSGGITTNRRCETPPAASTGGHPRTITPQAPLDLLITGDSLQESEGPQLAAYANAERHVVASCTVPKYSTGLVRDDFFDWPAYARQLAAERDPEAVSFMIGGNDGQNMKVGSRILQAGSAEWAAEYQKRAAAVMGAFANGHRTVYWIGMPIARSARLTGIYRVMNDAVRRAAGSVSGVRFVDIWAMYAPNGHYQDDFADESGRVRRMRNSDGIHLSVAGAAFLARRMLAILNADWHLTG